jgi:hypothetical protein
MKRTCVLISAATLLCGIQSAFAQAEDPAAPPPDGTTPPATTTTTTAAGPIAWVDAIIDRPLTMPKGKVGLYGDLDILRVSTTVAGMTASSTAEGLHLGFGYGVDDKLEVGAEYAFTLHDFEIKGPLTLYGSYALFHKDKLTIGASADLRIDFNGVGSVDTTTGAVSSSTNLALEAGLGIRYKVAEKIAVFTGSPIAPGPLGQHLHIGLNNSGPISFDIPVGLALQATPQLYAWVQTNIAHIKFANDSNAFLFADVIPLQIGALFAASHQLDVGAFLNLPDLENAQFDILQFGIMGRYYM